MNTELTGLPTNWAWETMGEIADVVGGGTPKTNDPTNYEDGMVQEGEIIWAMDRPIVSAGLKIVRVSHTDLPCFLVQRMARMQCVNRNVESYIFFVMQTSQFERHLLGGQTGMQLPHVSGSNIGPFAIPFPPLEEQERIVDEVDRRLSLVHEVDTQIEINLKCVESLHQSILPKAFFWRFFAEDVINTRVLEECTVRGRATAGKLSGARHEY